MILLLLIAITSVVIYIQNRDPEIPSVQTIFQFLDAAKGAAAILMAMALFLITLETRLKRRRALQEVHELRAMAHLIDMHQLTKDPIRLSDLDSPVNVADQSLDANGMDRYLHYCTELLAVLSKVGQLYVQDFPDAEALNSVDHFEELATGLSSKIWQKLMILDRIRSSDKKCD
ncbi:MAG: hypothetical protein K8T89_25220 [Planctomycetes bacterium]|nr:hypothetical protein [Planctomycetota bacterium]